VSATPVAADASKHLPEFCEVRVTISPTPGSQIGAVYRLPASWNGKVLGIGGGGFAGNLRVEAAADGLARGYAVIENDLGHASASALDPSFAIGADGKPNVDGIIDFGHRATHLATTTGKEIIVQRYGRTPEHASWQGCSTGGRPGRGGPALSGRLRRRIAARWSTRSPRLRTRSFAQAFHAKPDQPCRPHADPRRGARARRAGRNWRRILNDPRSCMGSGQLTCGRRLRRALPDPVVDRAPRPRGEDEDGKPAAMPPMRGGESDWVARMIGKATTERAQRDARRSIRVTS
jgi:hypothetical protein